MIEEDEFEDYCEQRASDLGYIPEGFPSWIVIDWEATSNNVKHNYTCIDYKGKSYLYR